MDNTPTGTIVQLSPADYLKLRLTRAETELAVIRLLRTRDALIEELARKYGFNPDIRTVQYNDETFQIAFPNKTE